MVSPWYRRIFPTRLAAHRQAVASPGSPSIEVIAAALTAVQQGKIRRLIINLPPRHPILIDHNGSVIAGQDRRVTCRKVSMSDPVRLAGTLYNLYDRDSHIERILGLLNDLEARR